jgi:hypothetical protein
MIDSNPFAIPEEQVRAWQNRSRTKSKRPKKPKPEIQFYQFPKSVLTAIYRAKYMPALAVAMAVYEGWFRDFEKKKPIKLTTALLADFGISRDQKYRALKILESSNQFLVERSLRRNPLVMMKWKLPKD